MFFLVLVTALLASSVILPAVAIAGWRPDLLALTVVAFGLAEGPETGTRYGFAAGLASDLLAGTDQLVGLSSLVLLLLGYASGHARPYFSIATLGGSAAVGALAGVFAASGEGLLTVLLDPSRLSPLTLLESTVVTGAYSALLAPFVLRPVTALSRRVGVAAASDVGSLGGRK